jgi:outer membrane protein assembly factor BamB
MLYSNTLIFGSWDCHIYAIDMKTGKPAWVFSTSSQNPAPMPPAYASFEMEIKKSGFSENAFSEEKYSSKSKSSSLSQYSIKSEYAATSDYKTKSDYDVNLVPFDESNLSLTAQLPSMNPVVTTTTTGTTTFC